MPSESRKSPTRKFTADERPLRIDISVLKSTPTRRLARALVRHMLNGLGLGESEEEKNATEASRDEVH